MLEIFKTSTKEKDGKTYSFLEELSEIEDDCWINLSAPTEDELDFVEKGLGIPSEFLRDPLDEEERPRIDIDEDENHVLIITDLPFIKREGLYAKYETQPIGILLSGKTIVTISLRESSTIEQFKSQRMRNLKTSFRTRFTLQIMLAGAKDYLKFLRFMDKTIEAAQDELTKSISNKELHKLMELGKSLIYFSTSLKSNEAVLEKLMRYKHIKLYEDDQELLEDVMIEYKQAYDMANIYASVINSTMDAYSSIISNNLNSVMKFFVATTTLLFVPTMIFSFFGQSFPMPWSEYTAFTKMPWPFIGVLAGTGIVTAFTVWWLKKRDIM